MSLRKASSSNSTTPLKKNKMDPFSYGVNQDGEPTNGVNNDDYDKTDKKQRSPASGNILGIHLPTMSSLSPSNSYEQANTTTMTPPTSQQFSIPPRRSYSNDSKRLSTPQQLPPPFVIKCTAIASLGGVLFGYDMGVIAGALPQLTTTFDLTDQQEELVVSILYLGGGLGAAFGGSLCDFLGRKPAILWTDVTFMIGASVLFTAPHLVSVCVGRVIVGFAVAVSGIADVSYLHEIAPTQWRGAIVSVNEACISLGFLLAFVVGTVLTPPSDNGNGDDDINIDGDSSHAPRGWRYMFGLGGVLALIQFVGMWSMPESPIWLKEQGRHDEARAAVRRIHGTAPIPPEDDLDGMDHAEEEDEYLDDNYDDEPSSSTPPTSSRPLQKTPPRTSQDVAIESKASYESLSSNPAGRIAIPTTMNSLGPPSDNSFRYKFRLFLHKLGRGWRQLKGTLSRYRRQVWIALFLSVTQQFCGQTSVLNYAPMILRAVVQQDSDEEGEVSDWATLSIGVVKFLATILVIWKIETVGRRTLLLVGMGTIAFGLLLVAIAFSASSPFLRENHADGDGVLVQSGSGMYFALPGVLLVVSGYSMSFGPLTWLITSELFPTDIRGRALGSSTIVTYLCAAMVTYSFLTAQSLMGTTAVFMIYMLITLAGMVFACLAIPDTGGKTQDEIDGDLATMPFWRRFSGPEPKRRRRVSSTSRLSTLEGGNVLNGAGRLVETELT